MAGGRAVELLAEQAESDPPVYFPIPMRHHRDCRHGPVFCTGQWTLRTVCRFSFTGLKAAVRDYAAKERARLGLDCDQVSLAVWCGPAAYSAVAA